MYGWVGKIVKADLSTGKILNLETMKYADRFIGGRGIQAKIAWDEIPPKTGPYDAENRLMFFSGPLSGTLVPSSGRTNVTAISPWPSPPAYARSSAGGDFAGSMKFAGYDGIVTLGISDRPVYLWLHDGKAEIIDADDLWGLDTRATKKVLAERHGKETQAMVIGPAGENLVRWSSIQTGIDSTIAQGGFGAVMGSKKLKAVAVTESGVGVKVARPKELIELVKYANSFLSRPEQPPLWKGYHTLTIPRIWKVTKKLREKIVRPYACFTCPIACKPLLKVPEIGVHSGMCGDLLFYTMAEAKKKGEAYLAAMEGIVLPDLYGLNNKGVAALVQWLKNCHDAGLIVDDDVKKFLSTLEDYGTREWLRDFCEKVSYRKGFAGDLMAEGVHYASLRLGEEAKKYDTWNVHGFPPHGMRDTHRHYKAVYIMAAMDTRGDVTADHRHAIEILNKELRSPDPSAYITVEDIVTISKEIYRDERALDQTTWEGKVNVVLHDNQCAAVKDSLVVCDGVFPILTSMYTDDHRGDTSLESKLFAAVTGRETSEQGLLNMGERIINLERAIQVREGWTRDDDVLGESFFSQPGNDFTTIGPNGKPVKIKASPIDRTQFEDYKTQVYIARGWNSKTGIPTRETFKKLDLKEVADELESLELLP